MPFTIQNRPVGEFAEWATVPGAELVTGDFNRDGRTDLALVNENAGWTTVPVALSTDTGFTIQNRPVGEFAGWATVSGAELVTGDFNGDRRTDLALVNEEAGWTTVPVALSTNTGFTIQNRPVGEFAGWATVPGAELVTGDFNKDGKTDLALVNEEAGWTTIPVALSTSTGFRIQNRPVGEFAGWATVPGAELVKGDFNKDGRTDLALVNEDAGWTTVPVALSTNTGFTIQNRPVGEFANWATVPGAELVTGDFNRDGRTDLALVNEDAGWTTVPVALSTNTGFTIQNRPVGEFANWATVPGAELVTGDFNGDRRTDLALVNEDAGWTTVPVALSTNTGFTIRNEPVGEFAGWATVPGAELVTGDFNGDRKTDLALVNEEPGWTTVPVALGWLI